MKYKLQPKREFRVHVLSWCGDADGHDPKSSLSLRRRTRYGRPFPLPARGSEIIFISIANSTGFLSSDNYKISIPFKYIHNDLVWKIMFCNEPAQPWQYELTDQIRVPIGMRGIKLGWDECLRLDHIASQWKLWIRWQICGFTSWNMATRDQLQVLTKIRKKNIKNDVSVYQRIHSKFELGWLTEVFLPQFSDISERH